MHTVCLQKFLATLLTDTTDTEIILKV